MARYIIGVDEVGRGPLAGPITVAAIAATGNSKHEIRNSKLRKLLRGVKDSKKLSVKQREEWLGRFKAYNMKHEAFKIAAASVGPAIIDRIGISAAARLAVGRCLRKPNFKFMLHGSGSKVFLDGSLYAPRTYENQKTIIKGDEKIPMIAAASIVAKLTRDKKMTRLHEQFPKYRFDLHKGYGTKLHQRAIKKHGLSPLHRRSFCSRFI